MRRRPLMLRLAPVAAVLLLGAGCTVGADPDPGAAPLATGPAAAGSTGPASTGEGTTGPGSEATVTPTQEPEPGTTQGAEASAVPVELDVGAPEGWTVWQVDRLVLAVPPGMTPAGEGEGIPSSSVTFLPEPDEDGEVRAALAVFVETGAVGPLAVRTQLLEQIRTDQTGTEPLEPPTVVDVPGSAGATSLRYRYDVQGPVTGETFDSLQVDVTVQVLDPAPQYGVFLSGAVDLLSEDDLDSLVRSLRVVEQAAGA
jgi:hypothetical protein